MAVDRSNSVYITDLNNNRVLRLTAGSNTVSLLPFGDLFAPYGIAVGPQDDVYVVDFHNRVLKLAAGYQPTVLTP